MRILIFSVGVIGGKYMKNEEYKKLSIKEFTKAAGRYEKQPCWYLRNVQEGLPGYSGRVGEGVI